MIDNHALSWRPIEGSRRLKVPFLALNKDGEIWLAKYSEYGVIMYRSNGWIEKRSFLSHQINEKILLEEDEDYKNKNSGWENRWTYWTFGYEFEPTHFMELPPPPTPEAQS